MNKNEEIQSELTQFLKTHPQVKAILDLLPPETGIEKMLIIGKRILELQSDAWDAARQFWVFYENMTTPNPYPDKETYLNSFNK